MSGLKLTASNIQRLPFSSKRTVYIDKEPSTKWRDCDFILIVGARTKTAYLRYRPMVDGKRKTQYIKLGSAIENTLGQLRKSYEKEVMKIKSENSVFLVDRDIRKAKLSELFAFYLENKENPTPSEHDQQGMKRLMDQTHNDQKVGDLVCIDQNTFTIRKILQPDIDKESFYVANQKREYIQRVWNYSVRNNEKLVDVLNKYTNPGSFSLKDWVGWTKQPSEVLLEKKDYPEFFEAVNSLHRSDFKDLIYMALFTGQHPYAEIAKMRWNQIEEVDGQHWWMMEKGFHKTGTPHQFPLHPMVMDIINRYKGSHDVYVFPNLIDKSELHTKDTLKSALKKLRRTHKITWDVRCLRASFLTTLGEIDITFRSGILANQAGQNITEKTYMRGKIKYYDFKIDMINAYMNLIQDKLSEVSK